MVIKDANQRDTPNYGQLQHAIIHDISALHVSLTASEYLMLAKSRRGTRRLSFHSNFFTR